MSPKFLFVVTLCCTTLLGCAQSSPLAAKRQPAAEVPAGTPKNIIMVVADGMGPAFTTAYRNFADDPATPEVEQVVFDKILVGSASTYPAHVSGYVTDSAASATALATGVKSYNGAIGVDTEKQPLESVLHRARKLGMKTGIAVTSQINHATPASYMAHNESRNNYDAIAESYFDDRIEGKFLADVMLGGGNKYFKRADRDLTAQFSEAGYTYVDSYEALENVSAPSPLLGLFAPVGLPPALDDSRDDRLALLTKHAISHLENEAGFFLLVEASQVDWAAHGNDIASAMAEMHDLAQAMEFLSDYVQANPDTLVVLTADHSTGGLTIGANDDYRWDPVVLQNMKASAPRIAQQLINQADPVAYATENLGFELTRQEQREVMKLSRNDNGKAREKEIKKLLDKRSNTGWTTGGHTGVDVEVFAFGQGSGEFAGQLDNTDIAKRIFTLLEQRQ